MALQRLRVSQDNSLFASFCISYLLPALEASDDALFDTRVEAIFGRLSSRVLTNLRNELTSYSLNNRFPTVLTTLINEQLRPRLANYIRENRVAFGQDFFASDADFLSAIQRVQTANAVTNQVELVALSHVTRTAINVRLNATTVNTYTQQGVTDTTSLHLFFATNCFESMIEPADLSAEQRTRLFPHAARQYVGPNPNEEIRRAHLSAVMRGMLIALPPQVQVLTALSPQRPVIHDPFVFPNPTDIQLFMRFTPLREMQTARGDATNAVHLASNADIGSVGSWARSMGWSVGGVGLGGSLAIVGIETLIGELILTGLGVSAIPVVGIPIAGAFFVITLTAAITGKYLGVGYEEALYQANALVEQNRFQDAARLLDTEFDRMWLSKGVRDFFLTPQHHAFAHFIRAVCAEQLGEMKKAYEQYAAASIRASDAGRNMILFISQLQLLKLLKRSRSNQLPAEINREEAIRKVLTELQAKFLDGFIDLHWKIQEKVSAIAARLTQVNAPLSQQEIASINSFLMADSFFILRDVANGLGAFNEVLSTFFQGAMLVHFSHTNPAHLEEQAATYLVNELCGGVRPVAYLTRHLASKKFHECALLLQSFRQKHASLVRDKPAIATNIELIKAFITNFYTLSIDSENIGFADYYQTMRLLNIQQPAALLLHQQTQATLNLLTRIHREFGLLYETLLHFLTDCTERPTDMQVLRSARGNNVLHMVVQIRSDNAEIIQKTREAARLLQPLSHERNHEHQSSVFLLRETDPLALLPELCPHELLPIGNELQRVEEFLEKINREPACEGHFLLLEGPPGTGKTASVLSYLRECGHTIYEWQAGVSINERTARISRFFEQRAADNRLRIFFIDEIDGVVPRSDGGTPPTGYYNPEQDVLEFQRRITALNGQKAVLIGTTNYPERIAAPVLNRAADNRIIFPLPTETQRKQLLKHLFRRKHIEQQHIDLVSKVAVGYAPRELRALVDKMPNTLITFEVLLRQFNEYIEVLRNTFKAEYFGAELFMPSLQFEGNLENVFPNNVALEDQLRRLKSGSATGNARHTLLFGPPGSGKTTAVRIFAQKSELVLISIKASNEVTEAQLTKIFNRAKQYGPVLIFIDEIDRIAHPRGRLTAFLQTEMDGVVKNNVTLIGATNYRDEIEEAILSRFGVKIHLPTLTPAQLARPIQKTLGERSASHQGPVYFDQELAQAMHPGNGTLGDASQDLSLRYVSIAIDLLFGDLRLEKPENHPGITYLRMMDIRFSFLLMRIQEQLIPPQPNLKTQMEYIRDARISFFQNAPPVNSVLSTSFQPR